MINFYNRIQKFILKRIKAYIYYRNRNRTKKLSEKKKITSN